MGILRKSGIITQSTALAMHDDNYHYSALERYENHMGTFDNIMDQYQVGNGTAATNAALHRVDCSSGIGAADSRGGYGSRPSIKPKSQNFDFTCKIQNIVNGTTNYRNTLIGVLQATAVQDIINEPFIIGVFFIQRTNNLWACWANDGAGSNFGANLTAPVAGDVLQIKGYKTRFEFKVNGIIVATSTNLFVADEVCYPVVYCSSDINATVARQISVDYIEFKINP